MKRKNNVGCETPSLQVQANVNTWISANAPHSFPLVPLQDPSAGPGKDTWSVSHMVLRETSRALFEAPSIWSNKSFCGFKQLIQSSSKEPGRLVVCKTELLGATLTVIMHQQRTAVIYMYLYWSLNNTVRFFFLHVCLFDFKLVGSCCTWLRHKTQMKSFKIKPSWNVFTGIVVKASYDITQGKRSRAVPARLLDPHSAPGSLPVDQHKSSDSLSSLQLTWSQSWGGDQVLPSRFTT